MIHLFNDNPYSGYYDIAKEFEMYEKANLTKKQRSQIIQPVRSEPKIKRNEKCSCGSGLKYKNCCLK